LPESPDETAARVEPEFLKNALTEIPAWIDALGNPDLQHALPIRIQAPYQFLFDMDRRGLKHEPVVGELTILPYF
jgi:hypothetical protein